MPDEEQKVEQVQTESPPSRGRRASSGSVAPPPPPPAPGPTVQELLDRANELLRLHPEERVNIRGHDLIAGIAGEMGAARARALLDEERSRAATEAATKREQELLKLAEDDPDAFAQRFRSERQAELATQQLAGLKFEERKAIAIQIGRAMQDLPEWKELTPAELAELGKAVTNLPEEQVIPAYHRAAVDLVANKRARALSEREMAARLVTERKAWAEEEAGTRARRTAAPDVRKATVGASDEPDFQRDPKAWNAWYTKQRGWT